MSSETNSETFDGTQKTVTICLQSVMAKYQGWGGQINDRLPNKGLQLFWRIVHISDCVCDDTFSSIDLVAYN